MYALSLIQPWATLWANGEKKIETRSWRRALYLPQAIAIHASKAKVDPIAYTRVFMDSLNLQRGGTLTRGAIIGVVTITRIWKFDGSEELTDKERAFGDFTPGRLGFEGENPIKIEPIPCKGALNFFLLDPELEKLVKERMGRNDHDKRMSNARKASDEAGSKTTSTSNEVSQTG